MKAIRLPSSRAGSPRRCGRPDRAAGAPNRPCAPATASACRRRRCGCGRCSWTRLPEDLQPAGERGDHGVAAVDDRPTLGVQRRRGGAGRHGRRVDPVLVREGTGGRLGCAGRRPGEGGREGQCGQTRQRTSGGGGRGHVGSRSGPALSSISQTWSRTCQAARRRKYRAVHFGIGSPVRAARRTCSISARQPPARPGRRGTADAVRRWCGRSCARPRSRGRRPCRAGERAGARRRRHRRQRRRPAAGHRGVAAHRRAGAQPGPEARRTTKRIFARLARRTADDLARRRLRRRRHARPRRRHRALRQPTTRSCSRSRRIRPTTITRARWTTCAVSSWLAQPASAAPHRHAAVSRVRS